MRLLDLFCCQGGASMGYHRAGFDVTGVDIQPQRRYPFAFVQADAVEYVLKYGSGFDLIHASPPCQRNCALTVGTNQYRSELHQDLVGVTRDALEQTGVPYVIEQPDGRAPIRKDISLCGEMFGLGVIRHRNFELGGWSTVKPQHLKHRGRVRGWRHGEYFNGPYVAAYGDGGGKASVAEMQAAMAIDWIDDRRSLTEAIPPAYTEWIGRQFLAAH